MKFGLAMVQEVTIRPLTRGALVQAQADTRAISGEH